MLLWMVHRWCEKKKRERVGEKNKSGQVYFNFLEEPTNFPWFPHSPEGASSQKAIEPQNNTATPPPSSTNQVDSPDVSIHLPWNQLRLYALR